MLRAPIDAPVSDDFISHHPPERLARITQLRGLCLALVLGLITVGLLWELRLAPLPGGSGGLALKVLPLVLSLAGLMRHRLYTFRWLSLLVWLYVTEGLMRGVSDATLAGRACAWIEVVLATALFVACAVYVRLRLKVLPPKDKGQAPATPPEARS